MNPDLSKAIEKYNIEFDPYNFLTDQEWYKKIDRTEDILQIAHIHPNGPTIDFGWYTDRFNIYVIANQDWEQPLENVSVQSPREAAEIIYSLVDQYAGYD